jgi:hypothetical protein
MSAIASLTAPVAVKAGKSAAFSRGARVSQVRSRRALPNPRGLDRTRRENLIVGIARVRRIDARATAPNAALLPRPSPVSIAAYVTRSWRDVS